MDAFAPAEGQYAPAGHGVGAEAEAGQYEPAGHCTCADTPAGQKRDDGQPRHADSSAAGPNVPGVQGRHAVMSIWFISGWKNAAGHERCSPRLQ